MGLLDPPGMSRGEFQAFQRSIGGGGAWANPTDNAAPVSGGAALATHTGTPLDGGTANAVHAGQNYDGGQAAA